MARRGQNYLNNKDMLKEIHTSKGNYTWFEDREAYHQYDIIVEDTSEIRDAIPQAQQNRADRMQKEAWEKNEDKKKRQSDFLVDPNTIDKNSLIFRVMTYEHIPDEPEERTIQRQSLTTRSK